MSNLSESNSGYMFVVDADYQVSVINRDTGNCEMVCPPHSVIGRFMVDMATCPLRVTFRDDHEIISIECQDKMRAIRIYNTLTSSEKGEQRSKEHKKSKR